MFSRELNVGEGERWAVIRVTVVGAVVRVYGTDQVRAHCAGLSQGHIRSPGGRKGNECISLLLVSIDLRGGGGVSSDGA